jgi:hypothetical protein
VLAVLLVNTSGFSLHTYSACGAFQGHTNMLDNPLVVTILDAKWDRFARMQYLVHAVAYLALVVLQVFLVWLRADRKLRSHAARAVLEYITVALAAGAKRA